MGKVLLNSYLATSHGQPFTAEQGARHIRGAARFLSVVIIRFCRAGKPREKALRLVLDATDVACAEVDVTPSPVELPPC